MEELLILSCCSAAILVCLIVALVRSKDRVCRYVPSFPLLCGRRRKRQQQKQRGAATVSDGASGSTVISFYGQSAGDDNGEGVVGVNLFKMGGLKFNGKPVYPVAVHHDNAAEFLYKVIEVKGTGVKPIQGVVVDFCDRKDGSCSNKNKFGKNFLVDIHKLGFKAAGRGDGLTEGTYKVIGEMRPPALPISVWNKGESTYVLCSCTGKCDDKTHVWKKVRDCK